MDEVTVSINVYYSEGIFFELDPTKQNLRKIRPQMFALP
jgi:hypothetical protein